MKKWLIGIIVLFIIIVWQLSSLYVTVQDNKKVGYAQSMDALLQDAKYTVKSSERFHGDQRYFIFTVEDEEGQEAFVIVDEGQKLRKINFSDITLSRESVSATVLQDYSDIREILRVTPAYTEHEFTWEVVALDRDNKQQYIYYTMRQGQFQKRYILSR